MRKCLVMVTNGKLMSRPMQAVEDGVSITLKKKRQKYLIKAPAYTYTRPGTAGIGTKAYNLYILHDGGAVSVAPKTPVNDWPLVGESVPFPDLKASLGVSTDSEGKEYRYDITPEQVFERSDSSDLLALNLAGGLPWPIILMAMGAGGGLFLLIALGLLATGKVHLG